MQTPPQQLHARVLTILFLFYLFALYVMHKLTTTNYKTPRGPEEGQVEEETGRSGDEV